MTEIPYISDEKLKELSRVIRPVASHRVFPYPEVLMYFLPLPRNLRTENFLQRGRGWFSRPVRLTEVVRLKTLHGLNRGGSMFCPSIAEVLAQIPEQYLDQTKPEDMCIVAFETYQEGEEATYEGEYRIGTTVLFRKGPPVHGLVRVHRY